MERTVFEGLTEKYREQLIAIREAAHRAHDRVNQTYGGNLPYGFHLDRAAKELFEYGHEVLADERDFLPLCIGVWFHDSIEDARYTYHDMLKQAVELGMDEDQAYLASEIVYALTNEKGRTRKERADARYYEGIRSTPYAPFAKMCDRLANIRFSLENQSGGNRHMALVYREELPGFLQSVAVSSDDIRFGIPVRMVDACRRLVE